ncbi:MAG: hypothetical protein CMK07_16790 [Ponticaulis sp.]|nr:hypothetical protein [Ponticaulis sp.]
MKLNALLGIVFVLFLLAAGFTLVMYGWLLAICLLGGAAFAGLVLLMVNKAKNAAGDAIEDMGS